MKGILIRTMMAAALLILLSGCISAITSGAITAQPITDSSKGLPPDDSAIATAIAVQTAVGPRQRYANVIFGKSAQGITVDWLGREKFEFTGVKLYVAASPEGRTPGRSMGEIELTDPLGRRALFLYDAAYRKENGLISLSSLTVIKNYTDTPRTDFTILRASDLPADPVHGYAELIRFLADNAVDPAEYRTLAGQELVFFALSKDWGGPEAKMDIAISATNTGFTGYSKDTIYHPVDSAWPLAMARGTLNPANAKKPLYAKVIYRPEGGFTASKLLGVYQLAGFGK
jgi:hypothetical protein